MDIYYKLYSKKINSLTSLEINRKLNLWLQTLQMELKGILYIREAINSKNSSISKYTFNQGDNT